MVDFNQLNQQKREANTVDLIKFPLVFINLKTRHRVVAGHIDNMWFTGRSLDNIGKSIGEVSDYHIDEYTVYIGNLNQQELEIYNTVEQEVLDFKETLKD